MSERLIAIFSRLPKGFYRRLMRVSSITKNRPEQVLEQGLHTEEVRAGLATDPELRRQVISEFHRELGERSAQALGEAGRLVRARRAAETRHAKAAGKRPNVWLKEKAEAEGMTVDQYLQRPRKKEIQAGP